MNKFTHRFLSARSSLGGRVLVNTGALASANLWRIIVSFLIQLLVARTLGLESLGQYTVAMAYLNISQVLCEMGLPLWMVRRLAQAPHLRRAYFRRGLLWQTTSALFLWALLAALVMLLPYSQVTRTAIFWAGASLPFFAITSASATIFQAAERMTLAFVVEFVTNLLILLLSIWLLWQQRDVDELLLVVVVAQGMGMVVALLLLAANRLMAGEQERASMSLRETVTEAWPFFGLSLSDVLMQRLDILLLSFLGDARLIGAYSAAYNLVRVAIKLLQSIWRGVYPTLARLYPTSPAQAMQVATRLFVVGFSLCTLVAIMVGLWAAPLLHLVYGVSAEGTGSTAATVLAWLIWQAPLFFLELYATTWLMVTQRAGIALWLSLLHVLLLVLLLPLGALLAGAIGAAWGTVAAQVVSATLAWWLMRRSTEADAIPPV